MRILIASDSFDPAVGGVQRVARDLATGLLARGHGVEVLAPWADGLAAREELDGFVVHRVRLGRPALRPRAVVGFARRLGAARRHVAEILGALRPEVVHLHFLQSPLAHVLPDACEQHGVPLVATAHGRDVVGDMVERDALGRRAVRRVLETAAAVTAPSEATLADARKLARDRTSAHFVTVPNALPADMTAELEQPVAPGGDGVVAVGELHGKKGFDVLVRAVAELPGVSLRIAGTGGEGDALRALAAQLGVAARVELVGFVPRDELPAFVRSAAVQVVPSRREPFGLVILEGFACGVPVVASRVDGIPEVAGEGGAAVLVPPDDPVALAGVLRELLADPERRRRQVETARERARSFTADRTTSAYENVYELVRGAPPGDGRIG